MPMQSARTGKPSGWACRWWRGSCWVSPWCEWACRWTRAVAVAVGVEMDALAPQAAQHVDAERDQHHADRDLDALDRALGHHPVEEQAPPSRRRTGSRYGRGPRPRPAARRGARSAGGSRGSRPPRRDRSRSRAACRAESRSAGSTSCRAAPDATARLWIDARSTHATKLVAPPPRSASVGLIGSPVKARSSCCARGS